MAKVEKLSKVLKKKRIESNLTLHAAANEIGVDYVTYWNLENDQASPSYKTIEKLAKWLEIDEKEVRELL